jgi:bacillithiol biosynthesis cysteine-adding enzyme BshC
MEFLCIPLSQLPRTSKLHADFVEHFSQVKQWYGHTPDEPGVIASAREARLDPAVRAEVVAILREQNTALGSDGSVTQSLERLAKGAVAVVTGQQVGLFSGPCYSYYKALAAIAWARRLTSQGIDAVPVFWLATEDHDIAEINHTWWQTRDGITQFEIPADPEFAGRPVGNIPLGNGANSLLDSAASYLEGGYSGETEEALKQSYHEGETFGSAFGKLFARTLAGRGLILLNPIEPRFHRIASKVLRFAAEHAEDLRADLMRRDKELTLAGYHAQVRVTSETTLLFQEINGHRIPLRSRGPQFIADRTTNDHASLDAAIDKSPEAFSPNVLLRPIMQDTLLPTAAYIAGPAEVAYYAQCSVVYQKILGRMPAILPRPSFTLVEPAHARLLKKYRIDAAEVLRGRQHLRGQLALHSLPRALASRFEKDENRIRQILAGYHDPLKKLDSTLLGAAESTERKILYQFEKLSAKAGRAEAFRTGVIDRHERVLIDSLFPHRTLQERTLGFLPYLALHGPELLDALIERSAPNICAHSVAIL